MPLQYDQIDLSGGVQNVTSHNLRKRNEVRSSFNAAYNIKLGSAVRRLGYEKVGATIQHGNDSLFGGVYNYYENWKLIAGINDSNNLNACLRYLDSPGTWVDIISNAPVNTRFQCLNYLDELYVAGASENTYMPMRNVDSSLSASLTRGVLNAPNAKFIAEFQGSLYAINVKIGNSVYKDRAYRSSNLLAITFLTQVQTTQVGLLKQLRVNSVKYIKPGMVLEVWGASSEYEKVSNLTVISVDKKNNRFSFAATQMNVEDNDEIWLADRHNLITAYWNTDYPNPRLADFFEAPSDNETDPEFTAHASNANRLFLWTKNSFMKWDGANRVVISNDVGCVSHETVRTIGSWTIWLHDSGVWGYNESTGQLKLLSKAVQEFIDAIQQRNLSKASAVAVGKVYKLSLGELLNIAGDTTSTSTSSTSTSSTSTSTSSTSTSSTSTSSTSTSSTSKSTSTSSTSLSTSSTSSSSISTSISSTSTSTTTTQSVKKVVRLCYDVDGNMWWPERHRREIRFQFMHTMHGYKKPYFTDDTGRMFRDETGHTDNNDPIAYEVELGRDNFTSNRMKAYESVIVDSERAVGATLKYSIEGGAFKTLGNINQNVQLFVFPTRGQLDQGRDINYLIDHNGESSQAMLNGLTTFYNILEGMPNESGR